MTTRIIKCGKVERQKECRKEEEDERSGKTKSNASFNIVLLYNLIMYADRRIPASGMGDMGSYIAADWGYCRMDTAYWKQAVDGSQVGYI